MPAIVYLITRVVGNRAVVWVNELNYLLLRGGDQAMAIAREEFRLAANAAVPDVISAARVSFDRDKLESLIGRLQGLVDEPPLGVLDRTPLYLDWQSIHAMAEQGITFGNHTATHPNMGRLTEAEQRAEITEAQQVLQNEGLDTKHFAYPFGHHNDATARLANESGLHWIAEVGGDNHGQRSNHVGRVDIRAMTQAQLFAQIEVVEPVKSLLRRILSRPKAGWCPQPSKPTFESLPITSR